MKKVGTTFRGWPGGCVGVRGGEDGGGGGGRVGLDRGERHSGFGARGDAARPLAARRRHYAGAALLREACADYVRDRRGPSTARGSSRARRRGSRQGCAP